MAISWEQIFNEEFAKSNAGNAARIAQAEAAAKEQIGALDAQKLQQEALLQNTRNKTLQEAYLGKEGTMRNMGQLLAAQGMRGGLTESAAGDIARRYEASRNNTENAYLGEMNTLGTNYGNNLANIRADLATKKGTFEAEAQQMANTNAWNAYNAYLAQERLDMEKAEYARQAAAAAAAAAGSGSGGSGGGNNNNNNGGGATSWYDGVTVKNSGKNKASGALFGNR